MVDSEALKNMSKKHITEYKNETFKGFRVSIQKKGITFVKYFSLLKMDREVALQMAEEYEAELSKKLATCSTLEEILEVYKQK